tara:strand:+ start:45118 stop:45930 length:813 start_codon:yes stop_codon:yes gene_type:complete
MSIMTLTERQKRERDYYNKYATLHDPSKQQINLAPVMNVLNGIERRPWNSYWAIYEFAINEFTKDSSLLDFGTGPGENALKLAHIGYNVAGFDISDKNIEIAQELFKENKKTGNFQVSFAEELPYSDNTFEMIVGIDILHHVDIEKSIQECYRVLKPGGKAYFREPIEVPLLDRIRETKLVQLFAPKSVSFEKHITEDERKLNQEDDKIINSIFPKTKRHYYFLFARFDKFFREGSDPKPSRLEKLDYFLIKNFPFLKKMCGTVIYELEK